ncbi:MAG: IS256 family transposase [Solirubrobacterales bacterium]
MVNVGRWSAVAQETIQHDLQAMLRGAVRAGLEFFLEQELEDLIGAEWYARVAGRRDHRNGRYGRQLLTSLGQVEVAVPRARRQRAPRTVLTRYRRRTPEIDALLTSAYVHGVSTRQAGELTTALLGERVSRATVSRVTQALEATVAQLRGAPIEGPHPYLYLDATFVDARWARTVENVSALVAYAVGPDGSRRLLAITLGAEESDASWSELLEQVTQRGLSGVQLVIADDHQGLAAAVRRWLPEAKRQRCTVHLQRNVLTKVPRRLRARVAREVAELFRAGTLAEAKTRLARFGSRWATQLPEAVACLRQGFSAATTYFAFPKAHWRRIRTTNGLERLHGEIKRRIRAVGAFPDRASALRLITAVAVKVTALWGARRYLDLALLEPSTLAAAA